jgi:two-component sensor histidine kinase
MSMIHEYLYHSGDLSNVNFSEYLRNLIRQLSHTNGRNDKSIILNLDVNNVFLDINTAIPCSLIINELVSNSFKHAFPEECEGEIGILLSSKCDNNYVLIVKDNGIGFPKNLNFKDTESLGLQLVNTLVGQINGTIKLDSQDGTKFEITFKKQEYLNG